MIHLDVEKLVLIIPISELKKLIAYFLTLHDFVRGLRGASLGTILYTRHCADTST